jgi:ribonucleoside-diphosphate reductase alpha chain
LFVTSFDIEPHWHVRMQAAFQEFTDNGVSKTTNFPQEASRQAIAETFQMAFSLGVKGITVYRNNSRSDQPMSLETAPLRSSENTSSELPNEPGASQTLGSSSEFVRCLECD